MPGKHADRLRQARGQFSSQSHEPFLRKCLYKKNDPEILAMTPKKIVKIMKKCGIASFHSGECVGCVSKKVIDWFPRKKILNFQLSHCILTRRSPMVKKCNITGLRGQPKLPPSHVKSTDMPYLTWCSQARGFHKSNFHA
jgi:hypothetical protein